MQACHEKLIKTLGEIIKAHREKTGKSIYQISAESFIEKSTWRKIEIAQYKDINLTSFWKIAEGLEIPPEKLLLELKEKLGKNFSLTDCD